MCVFNISKIEILEEDTYFYKLVKTSILNTKIFTSILSPEQRRAQALPHLLGTSLTYKINVPIKSSFDNTEGMYCFIKEEEASLHFPFYLDSNSLNTQRIITIKAKKGTRIKWANYSPLYYDEDPPYTKSADCVLVEELIPISILPKKKILYYLRKNKK